MCGYPVTTTTKIWLQVRFWLEEKDKFICDHQCDQLEPEFGMLTISQTYSHVAGNQGISTHKATESLTTAAWMETSDFEMANIENVSQLLVFAGGNNTIHMN